MEHAVRASHLKDDLLALAALGDAGRRAAARLPTGTVAAIEEAMGLDWLPAELNAHLADAVHREAGSDGARAWGRASIVRALDTPLLRPLVRTTVTLFGLSPRAYYKYTPLVWNAIYRGCGTLAVAFDGDRSARITAGPLPPVLATAAFTDALAGSFEGAFTFCNITGRVGADARDPAWPTYVSTWGC